MVNFIRGLIRLFLHCAFSIRVEGEEKMPTDVGAILAVNHKSNWDPVIVGAFSPRPLKMMAKAELFKNPIAGWFLGLLGAFPVNRGKGDIGAIKSALKILKEDNVMLIFPEGKRNNDTVKRAQPGVVLIGNMAQVPIVPAYISGEYKFRSKITITFGEPYDMTRFADEKLTSERRQEIADEILTKIRECKVY